MDTDNLIVNTDGESIHIFFKDIIIQFPYLIKGI